MGEQALTDVDVRRATDEEVASYQRNGWVKMERLISPETAAEMLALVKDRILNVPDNVGSEGRGKKTEGKNDVYDVAAWRDLHYIARDEKIEPFYSLTTHPTIGENAHRFFGRDVPVGFHGDLMAVKMPAGHAAGQVTEFHQDWPNFPFDRTGMITFWIALADMPAEQGVMRFLNGSQAAGPLGKMGFGMGHMTDYYPDLVDKYPMSEPFSLKAGDCTVHNGMVVHGAPDNTTNDPRWSYIMSYFCRDIKFTGAPHHIFNVEAGCVLGQPIDTPEFPTVWS